MRTRLRFRLARAIALAIVAAAAGPLSAATLPAGVAQRVLASDLASPTALALLPDGRILVAEQEGAIRVIHVDSGDATLLHTVTGLSASGERGLLGLAPHPDFATNGWLYYYYTATEPLLHNRLARIRVVGDQAVGAEQALHDFPAGNDSLFHMGGALHFAADGTLFVAVGDHTLGSVAQSVASPFGKLHRFRDDGTPAPDNPFVSTPGAYPSVWAYGFRNPFTFAFQPETGRLFVDDVGEVSWEEIDEALPGANYGWPLVEGPGEHPGFVAPLHAYPHSGGACAITGGVFYPRSGGELAALAAGRYFFVDYCLGFLRTLDPSSLAVADFAAGLRFPTNLELDTQGRLLFLSRGTSAQGTETQGQLVRLEAADPLDLLPRILVPPASTEAALGETATFSVEVDGASALRWQRDGVDVPGATSTTLAISPVAAADDGARFRVIASNAQGSVTSLEAVLRLTANAAPVPRIEAPGAAFFAAPGALVAVRGAATDREDGELGAERLTFEIVRRHNEHVHPLLPPIHGVAEGSFQMPADDHGPGLAWVEIVLTATDSGGRSATTRRAVFPASFADGSRADLLTLGGGRFVVSIAFLDPRDGVLHAAQALPLALDSGGFWFFDGANLEAVVKVLDGRPINASFWLYFGALSDLEYTLSALDVETGRVRNYFNPRGVAASFGDVNALPADDQRLGPELGPAAAAPPAAATDPSTLELLGGRFAITLDWIDPRTGLGGRATARALTDEAGLYWFFEPTNLEFAVKLLDGVGTNGHFWLFHAGVTDLETTLTLVDRLSGQTRTLHKPPGAYAAGSDVELFPSP